MRFKWIFPGFLCLLIAILNTNVYSQNTRVNIDSILSAKIFDIPALDEKVSISVSNVSLQEFLRAVANSSGLNIDVQPNLEYMVINNFANVKVRDMLVYLCKQFDLDLRIVGNIITVVKTPIVLPVAPKSVRWDSTRQVVSFDFSNSPIDLATKEITRETKANIVLSPGLSNKTVSVYIQSSPLESALNKFAFSNGMELKKTDDNYFVLEAQKPPGDQTNPEQKRGQRRSTDHMRSDGYVLQIDTLKCDSINFYSENAPIPIVLKELSEKTGMNYFIAPGLDDVVSMQLKGESLDGVLNNLFSGSKISYKKLDGVYLFGDKNTFDFSEHKVIQLQNRSIDKLIPLLPEDITKNVTVKEFPELNSLFVTGTANQVAEFEHFIKEIDKVVPVILIEVIILYVSNNYDITTGIKAGLGEKPVTTTGTVLPGVDMTVGANSINRILHDIGWANLGRVSPNFYIELKALESQNLVNIESTPKLATLNGHEATLSIGQTSYYAETQLNIVGTISPQTTNSVIYKPLNADLSMKIKPFVSADEQITLELEVKQSDFTDRVSPTGPYGSTNRNFTSLIRVKNQDMVLLGGLMMKSKKETSSGIPLLSRIPIIKWFFSSREKSNTNSKLNILIRPTILN
jgi:type IV pilus assembly protein PilQ